MGGPPGLGIALPLLILDSTFVVVAVNSRLRQDVALATPPPTREENLSTPVDRLTLIRDDLVSLLVICLQASVITTHTYNLVLAETVGNRQTFRILPNIFVCMLRID